MGKKKKGESYYEYVQRMKAEGKKPLSLTEYWRSRREKEKQ